ncbi:MAG TPA: type II secretion system inner membrane protein GspF [Candidatus Hydrogenedentes bacterium]|nr:type II secretion system inner membrane protein GspF [Candidatus Hydrogenedentota bacterium]
MAVYEYKAIIKTTGKTTKGVIDADTPAQARRKLREMELYPTTLQVSKEAGITAVTSGKTGSVMGRRRRGRVSTRDVALMTRQFSVLLHAGMPLVEALGALLDQTSRPRLQAAIYEIRDKVNSGSTLGDAMAEHPRIFSALYINMVRAGEASGALEGVLMRLADVLERQAKLKSQMISTMAYPAFMGVFAFGVIIFLMMVIVPRITKIFQKQKAELPVITETMIKISNFVGHYWIFLIIAVFLLYGLWRFWVSREEGRRRWDRIKLRIPIYGNLHLKLVCARFTRTLGTMLQSGLTMLPALEVVNTVLENKHIQDHMDDVKAGVRRGRDLAVPLKETGLFPPMMIHMVELGQRSGEIEDMMMKVADTYDDDVRVTIDAMVALVEPLIIIVMGIFIGFLVLAILLPILTMSTNIRGH